MPSTTGMIGWTLDLLFLNAPIFTGDTTSANIKHLSSVGWQTKTKGLKTLAWLFRSQDNEVEGTGSVRNPLFREEDLGEEMIF